MLGYPLICFKLKVNIKTVLYIHALYGIMIQNANPRSDN